MTVSVDFALDEDVGECCLAAADYDDFCATCYPTAWAKQGGHCGGSKSACETCSGRATWCSRSHTTAKVTTTVEDDVNEKVDSEATSKRDSFCCLAGESEDNVCGSCFSSAIAQPGTHCSGSKKQCETCGGKATWCEDDGTGDAVELLLHLENGSSLPKVGDYTTITVQNKTFLAKVLGGLSEQDMAAAVIRKNSEGGGEHLHAFSAVATSKHKVVAFAAMAGLATAVMVLVALGRRRQLREGHEGSWTREQRTGMDCRPHAAGIYEAVRGSAVLEPDAA